MTAMGEAITAIPAVAGGVRAGAVVIRSGRIIPDAASVAQAIATGSILRAAMTEDRTTTDMTIAAEVLAVIQVAESILSRTQLSLLWPGVEAARPVL